MTTGDPHDPARPAADPAHVLRVRLDGAPPGVRAYWLARRSLVNRLVRDAKQSADEATDLGPLPLTVDRANVLLVIGVRRGGKWESITPGMEQVAQAAADLERGRN